MTERKINKVFLIVIVGIIIAVFFIGFGITYSVEAKLHSVRSVGVNPPVVGGSMSIYLIDKDGNKVPIGSKTMDIYSYQGKQVKYIAGTLKFTVTGKDGDSYSWTAKIHFMVEKKESGSTPPSNGGLTPQSIMPLQLVPGGSSTGSVKDYVLKYTGTGAISGSTGASKSFKVDIAQLLKDFNVKIGDKYNITIYAELTVQDTDNGSHDSAVSDAISFIITIKQDPNNSNADIHIQNIEINPSPTGDQ